MVFIWATLCLQIPMMKMMQQEKEVLQNGLGALDNARQWYLRQLLTLEERQKNFEKSSMPSVRVLI